MTPEIARLNQDLAVHIDEQPKPVGVMTVRLIFSDGHEELYRHVSSLDAHPWGYTIRYGRTTTYSSFLTSTLVRIEGK